MLSILVISHVCLAPRAALPCLVGLEHTGPQPMLLVGRTASGMSSIQAKFGARLRELRKRSGLTQQNLGERADVNYKFIGGVERGEENPSLLVIEKLAKALGVEPAELLDVEHFDHPTELRARAKRMIDEVDDDDETRMIFRLVRAVLGAERRRPKGKQRA